MMVAIRDLLVHVNDEVTSHHAIELAASLAADLSARLTVLLVAAPVSAGVGLSAETASLAQEFEQAQRASLQRIGERLTAAVRQRIDVPLELRFADGDPAEVLQTHSRTSDLMVISQRDPAGDGGLARGQSARLLLGAACPVLIVPHIGWAAEQVGSTAPRPLQRALVAWSDTRESARALHDAMPLLARASHVELVSFADASHGDTQVRRASLREVAEYLARHGVQAATEVLRQGEPSLGERMRRGWVPDVTAADALLSHAADVHADFIVMGGYGHSRLRELVLGGVTRTMLDAMTVPVLMSH
jgi:nucleotide-binding universal stress UspA family protein